MVNEIGELRRKRKEQEREIARRRKGLFVKKDKNTIPTKTLIRDKIEVEQPREVDEEEIIDPTTFECECCGDEYDSQDEADMCCFDDEDEDEDEEKDRLNKFESKDLIRLSNLREPEDKTGWWLLLGFCIIGLIVYFILRPGIMDSIDGMDADKVVEPSQTHNLTSITSILDNIPGGIIGLLPLVIALAALVATTKVMT